MHFKKLVPNVFYRDVRSGLKTFVDCLGFRIGYSEPNAATPFYVVERDGLKAHLFQHAGHAAEHHPEFRLETENIEEVYERVSKQFPELLHPNLSKITLRPWGAREFAVTDDQIGIVIQQW